ncbi:major facilitator superfamily domain-containing protein [Zychaea mexicana]|uniref:major facilitator superfamily domain-containing protein n=1 Tax=Zychaea mexicana TaxID=64656 RepID=UPI0022FE65E1|nr:major facilitator superfamily domain-containing protein [Zychaea mexicana]KAI9494121.1 major facilitator superfamily domain-containing protein [Zychaea mexicana]
MLRSDYAATPKTFAHIEHNNMTEDTAFQADTRRSAATAQPPAPLQELDDTSKRFTWRQVRTLVISSAGFFTDAYDIFIINLITPMLGYIYYKDSDNKMPSGIQGPFKGMVSFGQLCGQLTFGFLGDAFGRKAIYGLELLVIIIATINCATAGSAVEGVGAVGFLGFWRFVLGFGIGGDYPMSSTVAAEWSTVNTRGQMVAMIFSMQGVGQIVAPLVTMVVLAAFKSAIEGNIDNLDYVWRICIGLGAVPAIATVYSRFTLPESPRYAANVQNDTSGAKSALESFPSSRQRRNQTRQDQQQQQVDSESRDKYSHPYEDIQMDQLAAGEVELHHPGSSTRSNSNMKQSGMDSPTLVPQDNRANSISSAKTMTSQDLEAATQRKSQRQIRHENFQDFLHYFRKWRNLKVLLGVSLCWFFMDIAFYGTNLNQALILSSMGFAPENEPPWNTLFKQAIGNLILSALGAFPGYIATVLLIEKMGRKPIQYMGFIAVGVIFIILGAVWHPLQAASVAGFIVLFAIAQFFFNFGPNTTTFVLPAEVFPTRHRAKAHGIASASGKLGAIIATFAFNALADVGGPEGERSFLPGVIIIFGVIMLICILFTTWIPETKGRSLEEFEN